MKRFLKCEITACVSNLLVKVQRHQKCVMEYLDKNFEKQQIRTEGTLPELLQHEYDRQEGILAIRRAGSAFVSPEKGNPCTRMESEWNPNDFYFCPD